MAVFGDKYNQLVRRQQGNDEVRLGAGVIGHTSRVAIAAIVIVGILAVVLWNNAPIAINAIIGVVALAAYYLNGTWKFADKHPDAAALAGTAWPKPAPPPVTSVETPKVSLQPVMPDPVPAAETVPTGPGNGVTVN